jgi:hypothetical protein
MTASTFAARPSAAPTTAAPEQLAGFRLGPFATAAMFLRGAKQAVGLVRGDPDSVRTTARRIGLGRLVSGSVMLIRPTFAPGLLGIPARGDVHGQWLPRLLAAREAATGALLLSGARGEGSALPYLAAASVVDGTEAFLLAVAVKRRSVAADGGRAFVVADIGSALAGIGAWARMRRQPLGAG